MRRRSIIIFILVSILNVALLALLWWQLLTPARNQPGGNADGLGNTNSPLIGHPAPDFTLPVLNAQTTPTISLASFKGKPVVINVWNSTCGPCVHEMPLFQSEWQRAQAKGVTFIGIDFQDTQSDGLAFLQQHGITYPNGLDTSGSIAISYGVSGTPETFFIDRHGVVVSKWTGELTAQALESNLQKIA